MDFYSDIISGIIAIIFILGLLCFGAFAIFGELICNKKEREYVKSLNDHDRAVIHDYLSHRKININDFKKKQDKKEVKDENK